MGVMPTIQYAPGVSMNRDRWPESREFVADLVGIDIKDEKKGDDAQKPEDEYFGPKRDLESLCEFMTRWLSENDRWGSPIFIAGSLRPSSSSSAFDVTTRVTGRRWTCARAVSVAVLAKPVSLRALHGAWIFRNTPSALPL